MVKPKVRKSIYMSEEIADYYVGQANDLGISESAMMIIALKHYIDYQKSIDMSATMRKLIELVEEQGELTPEQKELLKENNE